MWRVAPRISSIRPFEPTVTQVAAVMQETRSRKRRSCWETKLLSTSSAWRDAVPNDQRLPFHRSDRGTCPNSSTPSSPTTVHAAREVHETP